MALISTIPPLTGAVDPLDADLVKGDGTSTYRLNLAGRTAGRTAWELWASQALLMVQMPEFGRHDWREWWATPIKDGSKKTNGHKFCNMREKHPDLAEHIDAALAAKDEPAPSQLYYVRRKIKNLEHALAEERERERRLIEAMADRKAAEDTP